MAIEAVRHPGSVFFARPRGEDSQLTIDLHRTGIDDAPAPLMRDRYRQGRLAAGGRACDKHRSLFQRHGWMDSVVILIAAPGSRAIGPALARSMGDLTAARPQWLHEGEALQFSMPSPSAA